MMKSKSKKRIGLPFKIFIAVFALYAAFTLVSLQLSINAKRAEQEALESELYVNKLRYAELEAAVSGDAGEEYVYEIARDVLGYVMPGERVFIDISSK